MNIIRSQFPALNRSYQGKTVLFADNASTTLKPQSVIDAVNYFYTHLCSNVHRGENVLNQEASELYEKARLRVADFIHASPDEIIFVKNATEGINLAAHLADINQGTHVLSSVSEHHSNFLPWFKKGKVDLVFPYRDGNFDIGKLEEKINAKTRLLTLAHVSNVTGEKAPIDRVIALAKTRGLLSLIDASQSISHFPINVRELGCDFLVFSGHKIFGPSGVGILFAKKNIIENAHPWMVGGGMVDRVDEDSFAHRSGPEKFEAGTPNIEGVLGLGQAIAFVEEIGWEKIQDHNKKLILSFEDFLTGHSKIQVHRLGHGPLEVPIFSVSVKGFSGSELNNILCNRFRIMARFGSHCAEPLMRYWNIKGTIRFSFQIYNTLEEVETVAESLSSIISIFASR